MAGKEPLVRVRVYRGATQAKGVINLAAKYGMHIIGGYVRWMCSPRYNVHPPGDIDLFPSERGRDEVLAEQLIKKKFEIQHESEIAWTFKRHEKFPYNMWPAIQVIKAFEGERTITVGSLEKVIRNFDFTVVRIGLINKTWALADPDFKKDERNKALKWKNIHCPLSAVIRACKYAKKGYFVGPMEILRLFDDWDLRPDEYKEELGELFLASKGDDFSEEQLMQLERLLRLD